MYSLPKVAVVAEEITPLAPTTRVLFATDGCLGVDEEDEEDEEDDDEEDDEEPVDEGESRYEVAAALDWAVDVDVDDGVFEDAGFKLLVVLLAAVGRNPE